MAKKTNGNQKSTKTIKKAASMEELLKKTIISPPKKGTEIEAKIIASSRKQTLFDIGWKSYAVLGELEVQELSPFLSNLKPGVTVKVKVIVEEAKEGYPVVSMRRFFDKGRWDILEKKYKKEESIDVVCGEYGKGGVFIDFMGIRGVIPKIQLTKELIGNPEKLVGKKIKVNVLEVDKEKNRLVVSQKAEALGISHKELKKRFDKIKIGSTYKAKVIGFSEFGAFCEVEKIEGLIHISEISWKKVTDPKKYLKIGSKVNVIIVEKNPKNLKLNLSIKRLAEDPWTTIEKKYPKDKEIKGEVVRKETYGYIIRLEPGIEGLIHISKLSDAETVKTGDKINVFIEKIDVRNRRISLVLVPHTKPVVYR